MSDRPTTIRREHANAVRGRVIRAWLLEQARYCHDHGALFPRREELADAIGICKEQARRHTAVLIKAGAISVGRVKHNRIRIERVCQ